MTKVDLMPVVAPLWLGAIALFVIAAVSVAAMVQMQSDREEAQRQIRNLQKQLKPSR